MIYDRMEIDKYRILEFPHFAAVPSGSLQQESCSFAPNLHS